MTVEESAGLSPPEKRPDRSTGSIPLSWARPAEDVSADVGKGVGVSAAGLVVGFLVAVVVLGVAVSQLIVPLREKAPTPPPLAPAVAVVPPVVAAPPEPVAPAPIDKAPEPATPNPTIAPEDDDAVAGAEPKTPATTTKETSAAAKKQAQATLRAARLAARDGDNAKAAALAEDAVDKDPRCYECWSTLAFLRGKLGDADGQRAAKMQARALAPKP